MRLTVSRGLRQERLSSISLSICLLPADLFRRKRISRDALPMLTRKISVRTFVEKDLFIMFFPRVCRQTAAILCLLSLSVRS